MMGNATSENWMSTTRLKMRTRSGQSATSDPSALSTRAPLERTEVNFL